MSLLILVYSGCSTCNKALTWLRARGISPIVRPIVLEPPTLEELADWIPRSRKPVRKWLNTSGQSYRALGKDKVAAATDSELMAWLSCDGKLVKRPVLVTRTAVFVGFDETAYAAVLS